MRHFADLVATLSITAIKLRKKLAYLSSADNVTRLGCSMKLVGLGFYCYAKKPNPTYGNLLIIKDITLI